MGNVGSIVSMIKRVGGRSETTRDVSSIEAAKKIILPGVGHFDMGIRNLNKFGLDVALRSAKESGAIILGICLGLQLMTRGSQESDREGLGWFQLDTVRFPNTSRSGEKLLVPHMGWNVAKTDGPAALLASALNGRFYFIHSYYVNAAAHESCTTTTNYGGIQFASALQKGNVMGVQFHPEKSHKFGMRLFEEFLRV